MSQVELKRGRKPIEVTSAELQAQLIQLEASQPEGKFNNRSALWDALTETKWAKTRKPRPLTGQVAMLIAKNNNLTISTPVGKRGREKGCAPINTKGGRKRRQMTKEQADALYAATPKKFHKIVDRVVKGSVKARIKLNCLNCSNWQQTEVRHCGLLGCAWYSIRPYRTAEEKSNGTKVSLPLVSEQTNNDN